MGWTVAILVIVIVAAGVLSRQTATPTPPPTPTRAPTEVPKPTTVTNPAQRPNPVNTPKPNTNPNTNTDGGASVSDFRYPNAQVISQGGNSVELSSGDSDKNITDWYRQKINSSNMNVKTFVQTRTNDNVLNKLVGAKEGFEVNIEIKKPAGENQTRINVFVDKN